MGFKEGELVVSRNFSCLLRIGEIKGSRAEMSYLNPFNKRWVFHGVYDLSLVKKAPDELIKTYAVTLSSGVVQ